LHQKEIRLDKPLPDPVSISIWTGAGGIITGVLAAIGWMDKKYASREIVTERLRKLDAEVEEIKRVAIAAAQKTDQHHQSNTDKLTALAVAAAETQATVRGIAESVDGRLTQMIRLLPKHAL